MSIADKLSKIAENQKKVFDAGKAAGGGSSAPASDPATDAVMALLRNSPITKVTGDYAGTTGIFYSVDTSNFPGMAIIPEGITEINESALDVVGGSLAGTPGRRAIVLSLPAVPPTAGWFGGWSMSGGGQPPKVIYVPDESLETYKAATNWSEFSGIMKPMSELVSPPELPANAISFNIENPVGVASFTAIEGMTWEEWCSTEYNNSAELSIGSVSVANGIVCFFGDASMGVYYNGAQVNATDPIIANAIYTSF